MNQAPTAQCRVCGKVWPVQDLGLFKERPLLVGDCYWRFVCACCCNNNSHKLERDLITWPVILHLILYNLHLQRPENRYFKMKEEICPSIIRYWDDLMPHKSRISNWENTVSSALSTHQDVFLSGIAELGQLGWWALRKKEPPYSLNNYQRARPVVPAVASAQASRLVPILKKKETKISLLHDSLAKMSPEQLEAFVSKLSKARQQSLPMNLLEEQALAQRLARIPPGKCTPSLCRLKAKLLHRSANANKRQNFNLDSTLLAYMKEPLEVNGCSSVAPYKFHPFFLMNVHDLPFVANPSLLFSQKLSQSITTSSDTQLHHGRLIKRDWDSVPPKLGVLRFFSNQLHPLDFVNVHSDLIQPVNRFLCQFFWPGIDVSEFLSCPQKRKIIDNYFPPAQTPPTSEIQSTLDTFSMEDLLANLERRVAQLKGSYSQIIAQSSGSSNAQERTQLQNHLLRTQNTALKAKVAREKKRSALSILQALPGEKMRSPAVVGETVWKCEWENCPVASTSFPSREALIRHAVSKHL